MFSSDQYELIDFGEGRRLERFGDLRLDRPCPAADKMTKADSAAWATAHARFERIDADSGTWLGDASLPARWNLRHGPITMELKRTEFGHLGVFPEQAANWDWIAQQIRAAGSPIKILNLFAYTGASTLIAAAAGAEVVHVDAAANTLAWARRNAELSGLANAPIRWIAEDAAKFVRRELKRENPYDAVILDPPSYGHGPRGEVWRLSNHLPRLLDLCSQLTAGQRRFMLLTCHTPGFDPPRLRQMVLDALGDGHLTADTLILRSSTGRDLPSGVVIRWAPLAARPSGATGCLPASAPRNHHETRDRWHGP